VGEILTPDAALDRASALARLGPVYGANPRVGAVITDHDGTVLAEGFHRGAGTRHAEAVALDYAFSTGVDLSRATAYVTLEPCNHTGRTGPCATALADAGIGSVVYAVPDPNPVAGGGAETLRARGVDVVHSPHAGAERLNHRWLTAMRQGRPYVIAKWAQTLDGRIAAADGTSFWITGEPAREHAHVVRAGVDAIVVGTGTVLVDDPELSARPQAILEPHQPLRGVMGNRSTAGARVWRDENAIALHTHDPGEALALLWKRDVRTVIIEGGSTILTAFFTEGFVNEAHAYVAPLLLCEGTPAIGDLGIRTMAESLRGEDVELEILGTDCLVTAHFSKG